LTLEFFFSCFFQPARQKYPASAKEKNKKKRKLGDITNLSPFTLASVFLFLFLFVSMVFLRVTKVLDVPN
jgi:hypothetical protein